MNYETGNPAISKPSLSMMNVLYAMGFIVFMFVNFPNAKAQNSTTFSTPGNSTYIVPAGVTQITVECWGGGGAGGGVSKKASGGGGAGGAYVRSVLNVVPGTTYLIKVGDAKKGTIPGSASTNGNPSSFGTSANILVIAAGGPGGQHVTDANMDGAGGIGTTAGSIGDIIYKGGNGAKGNHIIPVDGGAGGGGAGSAGTGKNADGGTGGIATSLYGGAGANSPAFDNHGLPGQNYGGGGSGGYFSNSSADIRGGDGAPGLVIISNNIDNYWTGIVSNVWNLQGNWSLKIPDLTSNAIIPSNCSNFPILATGNSGACNNLVIDPGASVTVMDNTLQIAGIIQNTGTFDAAQGTIEMKGAFAQSIPAGTFNNNLLLNLTINNPAHVTLNGTLLISGVLKAQSGNLITGGYLTLLSTASQTALIDGSGQGEVLGNVTMQRYLPSAYGYKYFGSPFQSATVNEFADDIDLNASFPTSYYYDENAPTTGWVAYTNTSSSLVPGIGYALNFGTGTTPFTVNTSGVINNGTIGPITLYNHNQPFTKGFNLVSNPYPSPIDWDATGWTKQNIDDALYFFDAGTTDQYQGTYNTYINGISTNGQASNIIGAQQGFFVHVSDGSYPIQGALTFTNNVRVNNLNPVFHKDISVGPSSFIRLSAGFENARPDYLVVYFNDDSQTGFVATYDALKLKNTATDVPNIYSVSSDGRELSIDALPFPTEDTHVVNLGISSITKGTLIITLADLVNLPAGYGLYLKDNYSGKIQDLQSTPEFRFDINNETYTDRFTLLISKSVLTQEAVGTKSYDAYTRDGSVYLYLKLKEEQVVVTVTDMTGKLVLETTVYGEGHHRIGSLTTTGIYIVSIYTDMGIISKKIYLN